MDDFKEIKEDLKEIKADVKEIHKVMSSNTASLITHEMRTTLSEKRIERFENGAKWVFGIIASASVTIACKLFLK